MRVSYYSSRKNLGPILSQDLLDLGGKLKMPARGNVKFVHPLRYLIGIVANQGALNESSSLKGAHFARLCSLRGIPLVFLVNTPSDPEFLSTHGNDGLTVKARALMMATIATSPVPKMTVVLGGCYGPSSYAMVCLGMDE